jgi:hypothetical protein
MVLRFVQRERKHFRTAERERLFYSNCGLELLGGPDGVPAENGYLNTIDRSLKLILERPYPPQVPFGEMSRAGIIALALFEMWQIHQNMCDSLAILLLP